MSKGAFRGVSSPAIRAAAFVGSGRGRLYPVFCQTVALVVYRSLARRDPPNTLFATYDAIAFGELCGSADTLGRNLGFAAQRSSE
jgi:hypothetical protein